MVKTFWLKRRSEKQSVVFRFPTEGRERWRFGHSHSERGLFHLNYVSAYVYMYMRSVVYFNDKYTIAFLCCCNETSLNDPRPHGGRVVSAYSKLLTQARLKWTEGLVAQFLIFANNWFKFKLFFKITVWPPALKWPMWAEVGVMSYDVFIEGNKYEWFF